jgi:predicted enzyme related to lactoylglutathione lyase
MIKLLERSFPNVQQVYKGEISMATQDHTQDQPSTQQQSSTLNLNSILIGTSQPAALAAFYEKVFGRPADMSEGGYFGWQVGGCFLTVGEHSEVHGQSKEPARIILNLETKAVQAEFERLKKLGVTVIKEPYGMDEGSIATLADPDGNFIQLMTPWEPG